MGENENEKRFSFWVKRMNNGQGMMIKKNVYELTHKIKTKNQARLS